MRNGMRPIHPGEILLEEYLKPLKLSASALARKLGVPTNRVTGIVNSTREVTAETAVLLAHILKTTPEFWLNLQSTYDLRKAEMKLKAKVQKLEPLECLA